MLSSLWHFLVRTAVTAAALWVAIRFLSGITLTVPSTPLVGTGDYDRLLVFLGVAAIIVLLNSTVKPVLRALGLPLTILTLGLFALVINAFIFLVAEWISNALGLGLSIATFGDAFFGAIIMAVVSWILGPITGVLGGKAQR
ncbi:phage holin family protein [Corynebacterium pacaense]|uniref:phage holin family protein n=1 Tax=Corynebacterium pacaense TaxID=1816684 RepID=UPI0009BA3380|nr:phage holin family protein [Corynebacterium pacaense]